MTNNAIDLIATPSAAVVDHCLNIGKAAFDFGWWFIVLALIAIGLQLLQALLVIFARPKGDGRVEIIADKSWLDALKGVLEALAKLPPWVAIFLAGFALWWLALGAPEKCAPKDKGTVTQPQKPAAPPKPVPPTTNQG